MLIGTENYPIVVSVAYYSLFLTLGSVLRGLVRRHVSADRQRFFLFLVTSFSALACSLENGHVRGRYGRAAYVLVIYLLSLWHSFTVFDSSSNPIYNVVHFSLGRHGFGRALWLTVAQTCGAVLAFQSARMFWSLDLCEHHYQRFRQATCNTSLQVSVSTGLFIESVGTAFNVLLNLIVISRRMTRFEIAIKSLIMCLLTVTMIHTTGFYLNPLNASNQTLGCRGTSVADHFLVYWIGPCVSAYLASIVYYWVRKQNATASVDQREAPVTVEQQSLSSSDVQRTSLPETKQMPSPGTVPQESLTYFRRGFKALLSDQYLSAGNQDTREENNSAISAEDEPDALDAPRQRMRNDAIQRGNSQKPVKHKKL